jgi:D-alanyl-D-alanine carboxypeptidase (penicillin-binding protein 5/6)
VAGNVEAFVDQMNQKARDLSLTNTTFKNANGLPAEGQCTSARDMAFLAYHYIRDYPQMLTLHSTLQFTYNNITQANRNGLLKMNVGVDGLKTGYVANAGYHLVATANREGRRLIAVVMGARNWKVREQEALNLLSYGYRSFVLKKIVRKGDTLKTLPIKRGKLKTLDLVAEDSVVMTLPVQQKDAVKVTEDIPPQVAAPVKQGQILGKVTVLVGGKKVREVNLLAKNDVPKGWQAYWYFGAGILLVLIVIVLMLRLARRRPPSSYELRGNG